jgi:hypothetical protein
VKKNKTQNFKNRNLILLSPDLSRGWEADFTLDGLRESREVVDGREREVLEQKQRLFGFLRNDGEEGALAKAEVVVAAAASSHASHASHSSSLSLSLRVDHRGKHYSLPPHLSDSPAGSSHAPTARPLETAEELRHASSKLVEDLTSRAAAADS